MVAPASSAPGTREDRLPNRLRVARPQVGVSMDTDLGHAGARKLDYNCPVLAMTAIPGRPDTASFNEVDEPSRAEDEVVVETVLVGLCGTDREVLRRRPAGDSPLIIGHEAVGRVVAAPGGLAEGSLVVGIVRRPCPEQCESCRAGIVDGCSTFPPVDRGVWRADGFGSERWTSQLQFLCPVPPGLGELGFLAEPASCVMKALRRLDEIPQLPRPGGRALVVGAGTVGSLAVAALVDRGMDVDVVDPNVGRAHTDRLESLGARVVTESSPAHPYALTVEASGSSSGLTCGLRSIGENGRMLVVGFAPNSAELPNPSRLVWSNALVIFSVNAAPRDFEDAMKMLQRTDRAFVTSLVGREMRPRDWFEGLAKPQAGVVKTVVRFA